MLDEDLKYIKLPPRISSIRLAPVSRKRRYVKVNVERFVNEIKKRPILYDIMHRDYKRISLRTEAWSEVALAMNLSEQECKKRWRSMRDAFLKIIRTRNQHEQKLWIHYRLLEFLLPSNRGGEDGMTDDGSQYVGNGNDIDYLDMDSEEELYDGSITVSYVTEDGKEVFQVMHSSGQDDPSESTFIEEEIEFLEETEDNITQRDDLNEGPINEAPCSPAAAEEYVVTCVTDDENEHGEFLDEERLEPTIPHVDARPAEFSEECHQHWAEEHIECQNMEPEPVTEEHPVCKQRKLESVELDIDGEENQPSVLATASREPSPPPPQAPRVSPVPHREEYKESDARLGITDPDERFLLSCAPILRRLSNKKNLLARLRIQQLLYELEYDEKYTYECGT